MKKLMLVLAFLGLFVWLAPATAMAKTEKTIHIAARGASCDTQGYISPDALDVNHGETVTLLFKNEQPTKLEVMGIPGGTFLVPGNSTVARTFSASENLFVTTWLQMQDCKKAEAHITVRGNTSKAFSWAFLAGALVLGGFLAYKFGYRKGPRKAPKLPAKGKE